VLDILTEITCSKHHLVSKLLEISPYVVKRVIQRVRALEQINRFVAISITDIDHAYR